MSTPGFTRCKCPECAGFFEVQSQFVGQPFDCPHCRCEVAAVAALPEPPKVIARPVAAVPESLPAEPQFKPMQPPTSALAAIFLGLPGLFLILDAIFSGAETTTIFQQIASRIEGVGGFLLIGLAFAIERLASIGKLIYQSNSLLWEILRRRK